MTNESDTKPFILDYSNRVVEHLGIKLYQNMPTNVVAEYVSNCWDADASNVHIDLKGSTAGETPQIIIIDDGMGMTRDELTDSFLIIGRNRRSDAKENTAIRKRPLMGRKGIGKLAGFGIANTLDVLSVPNEKLRSSDLKDGQKVYWLRFHLDKMVAGTSSGGRTGYEPEVIADGLELSHLPTLCNDHGVSDIYKDFQENCSNGGGGVCIHLHDTTLKRPISPEVLLKSLGRRFTVTLLDPDFKVLVNGKSVTPEDAFPAFYDFTPLGSYNQSLTASISVGSAAKDLKYWVRFVDITKEKNWPTDRAGIGVYSHGKIAQDRPFFFDIKGKEIYSRYIYGVVEADWLDELDDDVVSTDRRSVHWDTDWTEPLFEWGKANFSKWVDEFRKWKQDQAVAEAKDKIKNQPSRRRLSAPEEEALADLLSQVIPNLGDDEVAIGEAVESLTSAWIHEPMRKITKELWTKVFALTYREANQFAVLIDQLQKSLLPEAMGLAVTMAQRVSAITAMHNMIKLDKTETDLQRLIEKFPWLLGPQWDMLSANQSIKTLVKTKFKPNPDDGEWNAFSDSGRLRPDFVFLSDVGTRNEIVVFEIKGPECDKTLLRSEYKQLGRYLDIIEGVYTNLDIKGVLIGHDRGGFKAPDERIKILLWSEVLDSARALHVSYLESLLKASHPDADDARLKQISDFGGAETMELLQRLRSITDSEILVQALEEQSATSGSQSVQTG